MVQLCVCILGLSGVGISFAVFPDGARSKVVIMNMTPGGPAAMSTLIAAQHEVLSPVCVDYIHTSAILCVHTRVRVILVFV
jgi:hypothetical protein